jgi:5-hydroxyisourate hydrolase
MTDRTSRPGAEPARLTTHVLDLTTGQPARGVGLVVSRLDGSTPTVLVEARTDDDGRTGAPLLVGDALTRGHYEIVFAVGEYFGPSPDGADPYLDLVPIRFGVGVGVGHLHVALLVTPWSYTTYRGS